MASNATGGTRASWVERTRRWVRFAVVLLALACIVVFGFALANVTMRLQRHITARAQWKTDSSKLAMAYSSLASAAAGNDALGYGLLLQIALDDGNSLQQDSSAMPSADVGQRTQFLKQVQGCLPNTIGAFNAQTPEASAACRQLLVSK